MSDDRFDKIDIKLEKIDGRLCDIHTTQVEQAKDLKYHIERTDALQNIVTPLNQRYQQVIGAIKLLAFIVSSAAILEAIISFLAYIHK